MAKFSERSLFHLQGVHPDLCRVMQAAIVDSPSDFAVVEGLRTTARQQELYAQGRTKPGDVVTHADGIVKLSNHQAKPDGYGYAVDEYPCVNGRIDVGAIEEFKAIAAHVLSVADELGVSIEWGGNWKSFCDMPHFELKVG